LASKWCEGLWKEIEQIKDEEEIVLK
jgi:hypothetical protein